MQTRRLFMRFMAGLLLVCMLFSIPFSPILAETDETTTEPDQGGVITVDNPVHGLLDPIAENAPYSDSRAYLIYDTLSDTMLIGSEYDTPRQPASITQIMTILLALEQLQLDDQITITKEMYETATNDSPGTTLISDESRVFKGGSWADGPYYLSPGTRRYLNQNQSASTIGFRCAMNKVGSSFAR